ncbi:hypothetical protein L484_005168 [Morus notabilis]|uniref:Pentatricopeptide repeat-containing protein n=1 Tax=Morus notabilis TaxID=981085 RepID=W9R394_9ROSA|nr:uncharacterized protein LOC21388647 [Morus notabilis]EXB53618.1 hypothetical protein L484_005168 [Morus notabilis]
MKSLIPRHLKLQLPHSSQAFFSYSSSSASSSSCCRSLTEDELAKINLLLPRLCLSDDLKTATRLATAALLTNPPPKSLSLSPLLLFLASLPNDTSLPMSLLTRLRHSPPSHHRHVVPIATALASSYFRAANPKQAFKLFNWLVRPGSPFVLDRTFCGVLVNGLCRNGMLLESLKVLRAMVASSNGGNRCEESFGRLICRGFLREARVWEAVELSQALDYHHHRDEDDNKVLLVLDRIIQNWTD